MNDVTTQFSDAVAVTSASDATNQGAQEKLVRTFQAMVVRQQPQHQPARPNAELIAYQASLQRS